MDDSAEFAELVHSALWESGGELMEGAFVDHFEHFSERSLDSLLEIHAQRGFDPHEVDLIRRKLMPLDVPRDKALRLVETLASCIPAVIEELKVSPQPHLRELYHYVLAKLPVTPDWERGLHDPEPTVRAATLQSLCRKVPRIPDANQAAIRALRDPSPHVRKTAAGLISFFEIEVAAEALADLLDVEKDDSVCQSALTHIADVVNRKGISLLQERVANGIGPRLVDHLIQSLNHPSSIIRELVARSMKALPGQIVARPMLERLRVEKSQGPRGTVLLYTGFNQIEDESFPVLADLALNGDDLARVRSSFLLENFGAQAIPVLLQALRDPISRRPAAMSLGRVGDITCLPDLAREYMDPANRDIDRELEIALTDVTIHAAYGQEPERPEPEPLIQPLIDALPPRNHLNYPVGKVKESLNALPILADHFDVWSIRADGQVLCTDHESIRFETEEIDDPLKVFAVYLHAAVQQPGLASLLMPPPKTARVCKYCCGTGVEGDGICSMCQRLGWREKS